MYLIETTLKQFRFAKRGICGVNENKPSNSH